MVFFIGVEDVEKVQKKSNTYQKRNGIARLIPLP